MVIHVAVHLTVALCLNPYIFVRVEIDAFGKSIFTHTGEPYTILRLDFRFLVQVAGRDSQRSVFVGDWAEQYSIQ